MRNPRFGFECRVVEIGRAFQSLNGRTEEGWTVTLELDSSTLIKLFFSNSTLETERIVGRHGQGPHSFTIRRRPALRKGDSIDVEITLPVLDDE